MAMAAAATLTNLRPLCNVWFIFAWRNGWQDIIPLESFRRGYCGIKHQQARDIFWVYKIEFL